MSELELLEFKMHSLRDIIMLKRQEFVFPLPNGIDNKVIIVTESVEESQEKTTKKEQYKGLKRLIKSLFSK